MPSYTNPLRKLSIEIIGTEKTPSCHSKLMNFQKEGNYDLKTEKITPLSKNKFRLIFLRYRHGYYYVSIDSLITPKHKKGVFTYK